MLSELPESGQPRRKIAMVFYERRYLWEEERSGKNWWVK
jgi:hypothetical protein